MMLATDLSDSIWNAIADLVQRSQTPREIYYVKVKRVDAKKKIIYVDDFGDIGIPLVAHSYSFSYYDTVPAGNAVSGQPIETQKLKRGDREQKNPLYRTEIVMPKVGELVVVLDPWGAKRFPICIGILQSKAGYWEVR